MLMGQTSEDGYTVTVDDIYTPPRQDRTSATCEIDEEIYTFPSYVQERKVGSLHSHHTMTATPSGTDLGVKGLFYTYSLSIVISSILKDLESRLLGFSYYGEKRVKLKCGAAAKMPVVIVPVGYEEDWPLASSDAVHPPDHDESAVPSLGDCRRWKEAEGSDRYHLKKKGRCNLVEEKEQVRTRLFGANGSPIIEQLPKARVTEYQGNSFSKHYDKYKDRKWWKDGSSDDDVGYYDDKGYWLEGHHYPYDNNETQEVPVVNSTALMRVQD